MSVCGETKVEMKRKNRERLKDEMTESEVSMCMGKDGYRAVTEGYNEESRGEAVGDNHDYLREGGRSQGSRDGE